MKSERKMRYSYKYARNYGCMSGFSNSGLAYYLITLCARQCKFTILQCCQHLILNVYFLLYICQVKRKIRTLHY